MISVSVKHSNHFLLHIVLAYLLTRAYRMANGRERRPDRPGGHRQRRGDCHRLTRLAPELLHQVW